MFRAIIYALLTILAFSFLRNILSVLMKGIGDAANQAAREASGTTQPRQPAEKGNFGGDLVKDPVCGTFVSVQSPYSRSAAGKTHHFCSQACLDRFAS